MTAVSSVTAGSLSPGQVLQYSGQQSDARQNLLQSKASGEYQRAMSALGYGKRMGQMTRQFDRARTALPTQYAQNNTLRSGLYQRGLRDYAMERMAAANDLRSQWMLEQQSGIFGDRGAEDSYAAAIQRILGEQYAAQGFAAGQLGGA